MFASGESGLARLEIVAGALRPGDAIDVEIAAPRLRHAASVAYGFAIVALVAGVALGHAIGALVASPNAGAFLGLLSGTFLAGAVTKRADS